VHRDLVRRARDDVDRLAQAGLDWVGFSVEATETLRRSIPFARSCWHTVDPGTVLFTGNLNQKIVCSGPWLAEHEFVLDDVNKWAFLARSGRLAGATSVATHGDLSRSARHRSHRSYGIGDELRGSFVVDGTYWGAVGLLRDADQPWFTEDDVRLLATLCEPIARAFRRALLVATVTADPIPDHGPGVVVFDEHDRPESISPAAERWIEEIIEVPPPAHPAESKTVQIVAARARAGDPSARARVHTRSGTWLLLYGTALAGGRDKRTAVIIQPAPANEVVRIVALAHGLTERECQVSALCLAGQSTKQMARSLNLSPNTVQDHLKSIFGKTGVRSRGELVGQIFLSHYVPRWESLHGPPPGWSATGMPSA